MTLEYQINMQRNFNNYLKPGNQTIERKMKLLNDKYKSAAPIRAP